MVHGFRREQATVVVSEIKICDYIVYTSEEYVAYSYYIICIQGFGYIDYNYL